ncbi:vacuolar import and degradation protein-domain-containing protein [Cubamyces lactineus]|nr:vacuolar import and degradation protein-domain-containing protein [Cubamyces lactineus]
MPAEHPIPALHDSSLSDPAQQQQVKLCLACRCPLAPDTASAAPFLLHDAPDSPLETTLVCASCRSRLAPTARDDLFAEVERQLLRRAASLQPAGNEASLHDPNASLLASSQPPTPSVDPFSSQTSLLMEAPAATVVAAHAASFLLSFPSQTTPGDALAYHLSPVHPVRQEKPLQPSPATSPVLTRPTLTPIDTSHASSSQAPTAPRSDQASASHASGSRQRAHPAPFPAPDPLQDITRLRVRSQGHHCLYPGATFQGTQKSGRNSYDVNVTIVDIDFASSHLCGYLRIRGLTDDWPELTTYFDAEIIGSRYGFLTRNWGATEQEDMVHWGRFPAFRHVKNELNKPHLTMKDALNRGAVFMRWKEKFLVPDHRVQDINGASFAGFYYVCVDFNPQQTGSGHATPQVDKVSDIPATPTTTAQAPSATKPESVSRSRRISTSRSSRRAGRSASRGCPSNVATMSGFYFHQNSEPYQQLSLVHVPEHTSSCFEFR